MSDLRRREQAIDRLNGHYVQCSDCMGEYYCPTAQGLRAKVPDLLRCAKCGLWIEAKNGVLPVHALFNVRCAGSEARAEGQDGTDVMA